MRQKSLIDALGVTKEGKNCVYLMHELLLTVWCTSKAESAKAVNGSDHMWYTESVITKTFTSWYDKEKYLVNPWLDHCPSELGQATVTKNVTVWLLCGADQP